MQISVMAGTLDGPTGLGVKGHIFWAAKGNYYEIGEGQRQAQGAEAELTTRVRDT